MLVKKASAVKKISQEEEPEEKKTNWKKFCFFCKNSLGPKSKNFFLVVLEKLARRFRMLFLKSETALKGWGDRMRERRNTKKEDAGKKQEDATLRKLEEYEPKAEREEIREEILEKEEKPIRPMISDKVVTPRSKTEMKDRLEEILVERIALNPRDLEAYERLGEYYLEIEDYNDAKECFKQVVKLDPTNRRAKFKLKKLENIIGR